LGAFPHLFFLVLHLTDRGIIKSLV